MLIRLPNERQVVVDAKVPLAAYLDALESDDARSSLSAMKAHARQLRDPIISSIAEDELSQFENTPSLWCSSSRTRRF